MPPKGHIEVSYANKVVYYRVCGLANMYVAPALQEFSNNMLARGYLTFILDLQQCCGMDSTFMGTLVGISLMKNENQIPTQVNLVNCSQENLKLLQNLGVDQFLQIHPNSIDFPTMKLQKLPNEIGKKSIETIYRAHKHLVEISQANFEKFGAFLQTLAKELNQK